MDKPIIIVLLLFNWIASSRPADPPAIATSSLTFVFDVTGSMHDDLLQVIRGATQIYNATLQRQYSIYDYILIPFADPGRDRKTTIRSVLASITRRRTDAEDARSNSISSRFTRVNRAGWRRLSRNDGHGDQIGLGTLVTPFIHLCLHRCSIERLSAWWYGAQVDPRKTKPSIENRRKIASLLSFRTIEDRLRHDWWLWRCQSYWLWSVP